MKIRPSILIISTGLVVALVTAIVTKQDELVKFVALALVSALTKLVESEEVK